MKEAFQAVGEGGERVTGYVGGQDIGKKPSEATRGELYYIEVPKSAQRKGVGLELATKAIEHMKASGAKTVNISPTSDGGRALIAKLVATGVISEAITTTESGKAEYTIGGEGESRRHPGFSGWGKTLTTNQKGMLTRWGGKSRDRRKSQLAGEIDEAWDAMLDSAPEYEGEVVRGMSRVPDDVVSKWIAGATLELQSDQSATFDEKYAEKYIGTKGYGRDNASVKWVMEQNSGAWLEEETDVWYGDPQTGRVSESEVVVRRGSRHRVKSVEFLDRTGNPIPDDLAEQMKMSSVSMLQEQLAALQGEKVGLESNGVTFGRAKTIDSRIADVATSLESVENSPAKLPDGYMPHHNHVGHYRITLEEV